MNHDEEVQVVKKALELEKEAQKCNEDYLEVSSEEFPPIQPAPQKVEVKKAPYPKAKSTIKFNFAKALIPTGILFALIAAPYVGFLLSFVGLLWLVYCILKFIKERKADVQRIQSSEEFKNSCARVDMEYQKNLEDAELKYQSDMDDYNNTVVVEYRRNKDAWEKTHFAIVEQARIADENASKALQQHYDNTKLIPAKYHNIETLEYMYDTISSSQYSLKETIDDYERNEQRILETARLREQENANALAREQADLTAEQNAIAERARRDQNMANLVSSVQRHNTNKALNNLRKR